ncbi:Nucleotidyltransferase domain protein [Tepidimonas sediminis]|uniref:Nucleotidyltransferase domain protein n=2 Tax=Tepidimonas sediminis TaxID=2588941 RepID=A0A554WND1_9BURK|nr:Nucleotidyltransferase domain protein [Tepidimonas sediminis]
MARMNAKVGWDGLDPRDRAVILGLLMPVARRHGAQVRLFGSRARGDARPQSDIDLALCAGNPLPADELAALREALEASSVPFRIDLVDHARAGPALRQAIEREGVPWTG